MTRIPIPCDLKLFERDMYIMRIQDMIKKREQFLFEKKKSLDKNVVDNEYLNGVKQDYEKYFKFIIKYKEEQIEAFKKIEEYIQNIIVSEKLSEEEIKNAKEEHNQIINEIEKIRNSLNFLISNNNN
jgi:SMC interacting uncharacterized protein involved in chromosome segregation